jgi:DNA-binding XRE family transcriptional regulator
VVDKVAVGQVIRGLRTEAGLLQKTLARQAGIAIPRMNGIERGRYCPTVYEIGLISTALRCPPFRILMTQGQWDAFEKGTRRNGRTGRAVRH